ncbi:hypothetical protein BDF14DRAFT_1740225 [Spinellus fusiger]|nr:hypothetical protein BDF14DRAFT_1740225 [Spinellus fusiger]
MKPILFYEEQEMQKPNMLLDRIRDFRQQRISRNSAGLYSNSHVQAYQQLVERYQYAKERTTMTAQATLGVRAWLKEKANITEANGRLLQNAMKASPLAINDQHFMAQLNTSEGIVWKKRKRRLEKS